MSGRDPNARDACSTLTASPRNENGHIRRHVKVVFPGKIVHFVCISYL